MDKINWNIINSYFKTIQNNLVNHQIDSYIMFVMKQIPKVIRQFNPITSYYDNNETRLDVIIGATLDKNNNIINDGKGVYFSKPVLNEYIKQKNDKGETVITNKLKQLYPNEARLKNLTYGINIYIDVFVVLNDKKYKYVKTNEDEFQWVLIDNEEFSNNIPEKFNLGNIPVMLRSKLCVLNNLPKDIVFEMGECKYDQGGYFIIDGKEKVLISQERQTENKIFIRKGRKDDYYLFQSNIRSSPEDKFQPARMTKLNVLKEKINRKKVDNLSFYEKNYQDPNVALLYNEDDKVTNLIEEGTIRIIIPKIRGNNEFDHNLPLFIIFRALGISSDKDILQYIIGDVNHPNNQQYLNVLKHSIKDAQGIYTQKEAFMYLSKLLPSNIQNKSEQFIFIYILDILQNHFIPHITENLEIKAHYLGYMVKEILDCYLGISEETDKDSYIYKRVDLSGFLVGTIFRDLYFRYRNNIETYFK